MSRIVLVVTLAASFVAATELSAQDSTRAISGAKSPTAARVIGIVPGAGHVYAGETMRGVTYFGTTAGIFLLAGLVFATDCLDSNDCDGSTEATLATLAGFGYWGWTIYDAGRAAHRANARGRPWRLSLIAAPAVLAHAAGTDVGGVRVGVSVTGR
jgi:hypothetical protein